MLLNCRLIIFALTRKKHTNIISNINKKKHADKKPNQASRCFSVMLSAYLSTRRWYMHGPHKDLCRGFCNELRLKTPRWYQPFWGVKQTHLAHADNEKHRTKRGGKLCLTHYKEFPTSSARHGRLANKWLGNLREHVGRHWCGLCCVMYMCGHMVCITYCTKLMIFIYNWLLIEPSNVFHSLYCLK